MSTFITPYQALQAQQSRREQTNENKARMATSYAFVDSSGSGAVTLGDAINFDCTFIEEPGVAHGWALDGDTIRAKAEPRVSAGVVRWRRDRRGYYTGAWVMITVDVPGGFVYDGTNQALGYELNHTFTFTGVALKDLPDHLLDY